MSTKISFFLNIIIIFLLSSTFSQALELKIIPLKKPILSKTLIEKKVTQNIIKPKKKPKTQIITEDKEIKPQKKPKKKVIKDEKIVKIKEEETKKDLIIPKEKPLVVKKEINKIQKKSKFYRKKDFAIAKKAISAMEKRKWVQALSTAKKARDKSIYKFIMWRYLLTKGNQASFDDYQLFIKNNSEYPRIGRLKYLAEHKLSTKKNSPKKIIKWFDGNEPLSGYGKLILGESLIATGNIPDGIKLIKNGWITAELSRSDMKFFRKKFKKYLNAKDYINRADYLAWENKYWDLKRMLKYLPKDYELLYTARQILMSKSYGVDNAIKKVPSKLKNDAGLNYDRLKWRRKRGRVDSSLEILLKIKNNKNYLVRPDKWWKERAIISRSLIYKKKYELAYKITSQHALEDGPEYAEAEWMSGWIALSFLNDAILATKHFKNFYNNVGYPISLSRGAYWLGKSHEKMNNEKESFKWYQEASKYLTTYYGQLAHLKIKPNEKFELSEQIKVDGKLRKKIYEKDLVKIEFLLNE